MPRGRKRGRTRTYVALLRGVNLGPRNKVSMADLRALFGTLGCEDVTTYVQSGNVVFKNCVAGPDELAAEIEGRIARELGLGIRVLLRTDEQLAKVAADNPFAAKESDALKLHVTFLAEAPEGTRIDALQAKQFAPDEFRVVGGEVYLHCPNGYGRTKLGNTYFEKELGVTATTRNWRTVTKLAELVSS
jgi:uncharacterized protein (DUF1697 family)